VVRDYEQVWNAQRLTGAMGWKKTLTGLTGSKVGASLEVKEVGGTIDQYIIPSL
jgi:hypothetical protein